MNFADFLITLLVFLLLTGAVFLAVRSRRRRGGCAGCSGCGRGDGCRGKAKEKKRPPEEK